MLTGPATCDGRGGRPESWRRGALGQVRMGARRRAGLRRAAPHQARKRHWCSLPPAMKSPRRGGMAQDGSSLSIGVETIRMAPRFRPVLASAPYQRRGSVEKSGTGTEADACGHGWSR